MSRVLQPSLTTAKIAAGTGAGAAASSVDPKKSDARKIFFPSASDDDSLECHEIVDLQQIDKTVQDDKQQASLSATMATATSATAASVEPEMFPLEKMLFAKIASIENIYQDVEALHQQIATFILAHSTSPQAAELTKIKKCLANFANYLIFFYPLPKAQKEMQLIGKYIQQFISGTLKHLSHVQESFNALLKAYTRRSTR
jgi:hypothetical protein